MEKRYLEATPRERGVGQGTFSMPLAGGSLSGFGSAPSYSGILKMPQRQSDRVTKRDDPIPPLPMDKTTWHVVSMQLGLSGQQLRIVELILRGRKDKEIAEELGVSFHTVRAYLKIIFQRTNSADRVGLVLHVFALAQNVVTG